MNGIQDEKVIKGYADKHDSQYVPRILQTEMKSPSSYDDEELRKIERKVDIIQNQLNEFLDFVKTFKSIGT